jgi:hypothetical protein
MSSRSVARLVVVGGVVLTLGCASAPRTTEVTRDRAVALARAQVAFEPFAIKARRTRTKGRAVWRVELKGRLPGQPPLLFETAFVEIDAVSGSVVSVAGT